ncbi:phage tail protein [Microbulbifer sp. OS29]|uniref:Phage tail protein n=1 Tax=Microbulbifer okhotskensis TaxID=2926617 RepID=A0A9X2ER25_9GAMM|nr:phage tail protein [Microbulbifer okhotskensis]MCO1336264.1 phage tail protein [Microbulbifer okhotskensis]
MPAIINTGAAYIAAKTGASEPVEITQFVLADIDGLDHSQPVSLAETLPAANTIVFQAAVSQKGYLTPDKVVYSLSMDTSIGDFHFNWLGLLASDGTLVAVAYVPRTLKVATANGIQGNSITRNFLLQFADAQQATGINVPAETWQIDLSAWLNAMDERERVSNRDIYGRSSFFGDGWKLEQDGSSYKLKPGIGYVAGIRIVNAQEMTIAAPSSIPKEICLDVSLQKGVNQAVAVITIFMGSPVDYVDGSGVQHYVEKISYIMPTGATSDRRTVYDVGELGLINFILTRTNIYVSQQQYASTTEHGIVKRSTKAQVLARADDQTYVSPKQLWAALDHLIPLNVGVFWHGIIDDIPEGWALCDGQDGRPNAINRVIVCAGDEYQPDAIGGEDTRSTSSNGAHSHGASTASAGAHSHSGQANDGGAHSHGASTASAGSHSHSASTGSAGSHSHTISVYNHTLATSRIPSHGHSINSVKLLKYPGYEWSNFGPDYDPGDADGATVTGANNGGGGAHNHSAGSNSTGSHTHSVSIGNNGTHSHSVTVNSGGTHKHSLSIDSAGAHSHSVSVNSDGSHSHSVDVRQRYYAAAHIVRVA